MTVCVHLGLQVIVADDSSCMTMTGAMTCQGSKACNALENLIDLEIALSLPQARRSDSSAVQGGKEAATDNSRAYTLCQWLLTPPALSTQV